MYSDTITKEEDNKNQESLNNTFKRKRRLKKKEENKNHQNSEYKTGRWSQQEQRNFINGCLLYGSDWKKVKKIKNLYKFLPYKSILKFFFRLNLHKKSYFLKLL